MYKTYYCYINEPFGLSRFATDHSLKMVLHNLCSFVFGAAIENIILEVSVPDYTILSLEASQSDYFLICLLIMTCKQHK